MPSDRSPRSRPTLGFTLLELLVVIAIMALASAGVSLAMRDAAQTQLEREAQRLVALLESARAQSRASGIVVRWHGSAQGFRFEGLRPPQGDQNWLAADTTVLGTATLVLGPEPIIEPQSLALGSVNLPGRALRIATDGLRPFSVQADDAGVGPP